MGVMVMSRLMPRNTRFSSLFTQAADNAVVCAQALVDLFERFENVEAKVRHIRDLEHENDRLAHEVTGTLLTSFITPYDREDILALNNTLDDFVDDMEEAARRLWLYKVERPSAEALELARVIEQQARLLAQAMPLLEDPRRAAELGQIVVKVRTLEDDGDRVLDAVQVALYDGVTDIPGLVRAMRWGEIMTLLEDTTDQGQRVANTIEGILLKNA